MGKTSRYIIASIIAVAGLTACGWHSKSPEDKADYMVEKMTRKLELTESQVVELEKLKDELLSVREEFAGKREETHKSLRELFSHSTLDQQRFVALVRKQTDALNETAPSVISSIAGFYDNLTPEQQAMLREKISDHHGHHRWYH